MKYIFRVLVSSSLLFLLVSFRAEVCKAQVPEGYSLPASDTTSVPASPIPVNPAVTPQKKKHHKNNNQAATDSASLSAIATPDSSVAVTKPVKKKHRMSHNDSLSMIRNNSGSISGPDTGQSIHLKRVSSPGTINNDSLVEVKKAMKERKKEIHDSIRLVNQLRNDSAYVSHFNTPKKSEEQHYSPPKDTVTHPEPVNTTYIPLTPDDQAAAIVETGNKLQSNGDFKTAMLMFDSVINYYPKTFYYKYAFFYRGQANALADKKDDALKDLSTFITLDSCKSPYCTDAHYTRALVYLHQSDFNPAINDFNFVISHDSTYKNLKYAYFYRAFCYGEQNVFPKAVQDLTKFLFIDNMKTIASADALDSRAFYKIKLNDNRGAIQDYDEAATLYLAIIQTDKNAKEEGYTDKLIDTYTQRGLAKAGINKWDEAILDYNLALKYNPNYAKAYLLRGLAYINQGKQDLGCLDLSKAGELGATEAYDEIKKYCK